MTNNNQALYETTLLKVNDYQELVRVAN